MDKDYRLLRQQAVDMREQGVSIIKIAADLGVSKGSVSLWVRHVQITPEQRDAILASSKTVESYRRSGQKHAEIYRAKRREWQDEGRKLARKNKDPMFAFGCALYWGEGAKGRNSIRFANSEIEMHKKFKSFLVNFLGVLPNEMALQINTYVDPGSLSQSEIENYWLAELGFAKHQLRKSIVNNRSIASLEKRWKLSLYGTATLCVHSTEKAQKLYGAIAELGGIDGYPWIDGRNKQ